MSLHKAQILALVDDGGSISSTEAASALGISRQATHRQLRALIDAGVLEARGAGRATRYVRSAGTRHHVQHRTVGLEEDRVWTELQQRVRALRDLDGDGTAFFSYALTELVNNVIDHSGADHVDVFVEERTDRIVLEVVDEGIGIFQHLQRELGLASDLEALQQLSKGKTTTDPERHTGEGLFFTSKAAHFFRIESGRLSYTVDNERDDTAVGSVDPPRKGTRVIVEADPMRAIDLTAVFEQYTEDHDFSRTRCVVRLFDIGVRFMSRSEAKRLMHGLDRFRDVILDFRGVESLGQGFADEVFRVWARRYPDVRITAENMATPIEFMVRRAGYRR